MPVSCNQPSSTLSSSRKSPPLFTVENSNPIDPQIDVLIAQMSLEEKIGQMTLVGRRNASPEDVTKFFLGGILTDGNGAPDNNRPEAWVKKTRSYQSAALDTRLKIPLLYGVDAVHGHALLRGATVFPHNIGLGATRNPELIKEVARITAIETAVSGVNWNYAPSLGITRDVRWGRTYESFGEDTELVSKLGVAYLEGLQGEDLQADPLILGTAKHFLADGGTQYGTADLNIMGVQFLLDRGDAVMDEATLREIHLPPYVAQIEAGARSVMVSYSSWNGIKHHGNAYILTDLLKEEMGFTGFLVSDWDAIYEIADNGYDAAVQSINAGVDMIMLSKGHALFIQSVLAGVDNGDIPLSRIDDAVRRILRVKMEMGLFERVLPDESQLDQIGIEAHREVARQAVRESAVLLTHRNNVLPIAKENTRVFITGLGAFNMGVQSGGWTLKWQGAESGIIGGTTILEGIRAHAGNAEIDYDKLGFFDSVTDDNGEPVIADVGIVVIGEKPYSEGVGDSADLSLGDLAMIDVMKKHSNHVVVILLSGRPLIISEHLDKADAWIAAWLPGTEGDGIAELLFGEAEFSGKLPFTWPRSIEQLPHDFSNLPTKGCDAPLFPFGHGLTTHDTYHSQTDC